MSVTFTATPDDLANLSGFLFALKVATEEHGVVIAGRFTLKLGSGDMIDATLDDAGEAYLVQDLVGGDG